MQLIDYEQTESLLYMYKQLFLKGTGAKVSDLYEKGGFRSNNESVRLFREKLFALCRYVEMAWDIFTDSGKDEWTPRNTWPRELLIRVMKYDPTMKWLTIEDETVNKRVIKTIMTEWRDEFIAKRAVA